MIPRFAPRARPRAVTLIELLCTIGIIALLATLLLGPAGRALSRARNMQWGSDAGTHLDEIRLRLNQLLAGQKQFPTITLEKLATDRLFTEAQLRFLRDRRVKFHPFSGTDPDDLTVIEVTIKAGFLTPADLLTVTKGQLTEVPK